MLEYWISGTTVISFIEIEIIYAFLSKDKIILWQQLLLFLEELCVKSFAIALS